MHALPAHLLAFLGASLGAPWVAFQEARILSKGETLPDKTVAWAIGEGIENPGKTRLLRSHPIPLPAPVFIRHFLDKRGFPCIHLAGLCLRQGIFLNPDLPDEEAVLQHELIHTRQYLEAGSIFEFLRRYLFQCLTEGYLNCEMEREARGEI